MEHLLIRYGELTLKGKNRHFFINKLLQNIKFKLRPYHEGVKYLKDNNSLTLAIDLDLLSENPDFLKNYHLSPTMNKETLKKTILESLINDLQKVFGIYSISQIKKTDKIEAAIFQGICEVMAKEEPTGTLKLIVSRKDKTYPLTSAELTQKIAPLILQKFPKFQADLHHPDLKIEVVIKKDHAEIFTSRQTGAKGLPVGVSGKGLSLLSGGIDSPIASYLAMKRGLKIDFMHFMTPPHTSAEALAKVFKLAQKLAPYNYQNFHLYICNFAKLLQELNHLPDQSYKIVLMRRFFMRLANQVAQKNGHQAIITGESLGQVASQTLEAMTVINHISFLPILRPVITNDKEEIIALAQQIGTYETSILPFDDVCSMFVPEHPTTKPRLKNVEFNESSLLWEEILNYTATNLVEDYLWKIDHFEKVI